MYRQVLLFFLAALALLGSCQDNSRAPRGTVIEGTVEQAGNLSAFLDRIVIGKANNVLGRTDLDGSGSFVLEFPDGLEPGIYNLRIGAKRLGFIFNGSETEVRLTGALDGFDGYRVEITGSPLTSQLQDMLHGFLDQDYGLEELETFIDTTRSGLVAMHLAYNLIGANPEFLALHRQAYDKVAVDFPGSDIAEGYQAFIQQVDAEYQRYLATQRIKIGQPAPDLELPGPEGKTYRLSDLRGQLVLLDFWASWCMPCRQENPNVVKVYNKYKDQGFTIFSVSLDRSRERWIQAIQTDGLTWPYHVSELKQWDSEAAATYGVGAIPRTFFIDREGKIAAINLRGARQIENTIKKHL